MRVSSNKKQCNMLDSIVVMILCLVVCQGCEPMTTRQKIMFGTMVAANFLDYETSRRLHMEDDDGKIVGDYVVTFSERNPFLDDHPSRDQIALLKIGFVATLWGLGEIWPDGRELFFGIGTGVGAGAAWHNNERYEDYH